MPKAQSSSTLEGEDDWHGMSDQRMRKRAQNRLAQRKHRTKLKLLEQLVEQQEPLPVAPPENTSSPGTSRLTAIQRSDKRPDSLFHLASLSESVVNDAASDSRASYASAYMYPHHRCTSDVAGMTMDSGLPAQHTSTPTDDAGDRPLAPDTTDFQGQSYFQPPSMANEAQHCNHYGLLNDNALPGRYTNNKKNHIIDCNDSPSSSFSDFRLMEDRASWFSPADSSSSSSRLSIEQLNRCSSSTALSLHDDLLHGRDSSVDGSATLSSRIESVIEAIRPLGFGSIDELAAQYYTADLQDRPVVAHSQRLSRRRGLTRVLASVREHVRNNWTDWEARGYLDEIVRTAEEVLEDEFSKFSKTYVSSIKSRGTTAELKQLFQNELPNLYSLLGVLGLSVQQQGNEDRTAVTVHAISTLLRGSSKGRLYLT